jgi:hypothetical protein
MRCVAQISDGPKTDCLLQIHDGDGGVSYDGHAGVDIRGRSSQRFPKKNYALELRTSTGDDNPAALLGMGKESDFVLDGCWSDRSFVRNILTFDTFRAMDVDNYAPNSRFCTLTFNGTQQGIYRLGEKIKRDDDRVNISADDGKASSFIVKQDTDGVLTLEIGGSSVWEMVYPKQSKATAAQIAGAQAWLNDFHAAMALTATSTETTGIFALLDFGRTVDWMLIEELSKNLDAYHLSLYFVRDAAGRAWNLPWDIDLAYGQPNVSGVDSILDNEKPEGWVAARTDLIIALSRCPALRRRFASRYRELRATVFSWNSIIARLEYYQGTLTNDALNENFQLWPISAVDLSVIYGPFSAYPVTSHAEEITHLKNWLHTRLTWLDANIDSYPDGE